MTAHKVEVDKSENKLPKTFEPWGSYSYLAFNADFSQISITSQFIDTASENRRGTTKTEYVLLKIKKNQFILKSINYQVSFDE